MLEIEGAVQLDLDTAKIKTEGQIALNAEELLPVGGVVAHRADHRQDEIKIAGIVDGVDLEGQTGGGEGRSRQTVNLSVHRGLANETVRTDGETAVKIAEREGDPRGGDAGTTILYAEDNTGAIASEGEAAGQIGREAGQIHRDRGGGCDRHDRGGRPGVHAEAGTGGCHRHTGQAGETKIGDRNRSD